MTLWSEIGSAVFAIVAAVLWLKSAWVKTPHEFNVQVITWHNESAGSPDGSEVVGQGHGVSEELEELGKALIKQSRLSSAAAAFAALSALCQGVAILVQHFPN